jgi:hypothetical protein
MGTPSLACPFLQHSHHAFAGYLHIIKMGNFCKEIVAKGRVLLYYDIMEIVWAFTERAEMI